MKVITTKEPGGTPIGMQIRKILLNPKNKGLSSLSELFLFLADRSEHIQKKIAPFLNKNYIVISDRFSDSTIAYQAAGRNLDIKLINKLCRLCVNDVIPDLTFLLDADLNTTLKIVKKLSKEYKGGDRFEKENVDFHRKVKQEFNNLLKAEPQRIVKIPLKKNINETQKLIQKHCLEKLKHRTYRIVNGY